MLVRLLRRLFRDRRDRARPSAASGRLSSSERWVASLVAPVKPVIDQVIADAWNDSERLHALAGRCQTERFVEGAMRAQMRLLTLTPNAVEIRLSLVDTLIEQGRLIEAYHHLQLAEYALGEGNTRNVALASESGSVRSVAALNPRLLVAKARVLCLRHSLDHAEDILVDARSRGLQSAAIVDAIGQLQCARGRLTVAAASFAQALSLSTHWLAVRHLVEWHLRFGSVQQCRELLNEYEYAFSHQDDYRLLNALTALALGEDVEVVVPEGGDCPSAIRTTLAAVSTWRRCHYATALNVLSVIHQARHEDATTSVMELPLRVCPTSDLLRYIGDDGLRLPDPLPAELSLHDSLLLLGGGFLRRMWAMPKQPGMPVMVDPSFTDLLACSCDVVEAGDLPSATANARALCVSVPTARVVAWREILARLRPEFERWVGLAVVPDGELLPAPSFIPFAAELLDALDRDRALGLVVSTSSLEIPSLVAFLREHDLLGRVCSVRPANLLDRAAVLSACDVVLAAPSFDAVLASACGTPTWAEVRRSIPCAWLSPTVAGRLPAELRVLLAPDMVGAEAFLVRFSVSRLRSTTGVEVLLPEPIAQMLHEPSSVPSRCSDDAPPVWLAEINSLVACGSPEAAEAKCLDLLAQQPNHGRLLNVLGQIYMAAGRFDAAEECLNRAATVVPDDPAPRISMCRLREAQGRMDDALDMAFDVEREFPELQDVALLLADLLDTAQRYDEAIGYFDSPAVQAAIANNPVLANNYGRALAFAERFEEALRPARQAVAALPLDIRAHINLAYALLYAGQPLAAHRQLQTLLSFAPNRAEALWYRSNIDLALGRFELGWQSYALRFVALAVGGRPGPAPEWRGEPLDGKTVLVMSEQGLGDEIMFASCLPDLLKRLGSRGECVLECHPRLAPLFRRSFPEVSILQHDRETSKYSAGLAEHPRIAVSVGCGSLGQFLRRRKEDFPSWAGKGYLRADDRQVAVLRRRLSDLGAGAKIGISWRGGTKFSRARTRTATIDAFAPLAAEFGCHLVSLQYGDSAAERADFSERTGISVVHWQDEIDDLDRLAALIGSLDAIFTVCNTTVHIAGALGRPVFVVAPTTPEWRYGLDGAQMVWYDSAVVRRKQYGETWVEVVRDLAQSYVQGLERDVLG